MLAKLSSFYSISPIEVLNMDYDIVESLWLSITMIEAQDQLKRLSVADWPNMKKSARDKMHNHLHSQAYPSNLAKKKSISMQDLQKVLGR